MESETGVDGISTPVASLPLPTGAPAADPLADAHCLKCGYALRGLTEHRCPECGNPFDPSDFVDTFVPKWPKLLQWWIAAMLGSAVLRSAGIVHSVELALGWPLGSGGPLPVPIRAAYALYGVQWLVTFVMGCLVVRDLRSRLDRARWTTIIMFVVAGVLLPIGGLICAAWVIVGTVAYTGSLGDWLRSIAVTLLGEVMPALVMIVYLATGLRRVSLARGSATPPPAIKADRFRERSDWLLLIGVCLVTAVLERAANVADLVDDLTGADGVIECLVHTIAGLGCLLAARRSWRNPVTVRSSVCMAAVLLLVAWAFRAADYVDMALHLPGYWWKGAAMDGLAHLV